MGEILNTKYESTLSSWLVVSNGCLPYYTTHARPTADVKTNVVLKTSFEVANPVYVQTSDKTGVVRSGPHMTSWYQVIGYNTDDVYPDSVVGSSSHYNHRVTNEDTPAICMCFPPN